MIDTASSNVNLSSSASLASINSQLRELKNQHQVIYDNIKDLKNQNHELYLKKESLKDINKDNKSKMNNLYAKKRECISDKRNYKDKVLEENDNNVNKQVYVFDSPQNINKYRNEYRNISITPFCCESIISYKVTDSYKYLETIESYESEIRSIENQTYYVNKNINDNKLEIKQIYENIDNNKRIITEEYSKLNAINSEIKNLKAEKNRLIQSKKDKPSIVKSNESNKPSIIGGNRKKYIAYGGGVVLLALGILKIFM